MHFVISTHANSLLKHTDMQMQDSGEHDQMEFRTSAHLDPTMMFVGRDTLGMRDKRSKGQIEESGRRPIKREFCEKKGHEL